MGTDAKENDKFFDGLNLDEVDNLFDDVEETAASPGADVPQPEAMVVRLPKSAIVEESAEAKPVAAKPVAAKPVAAKPVAAKPVAAKPPTPPAPTSPAPTPPAPTPPAPNVGSKISSEILFDDMELGPQSAQEGSERLDLAQLGALQASGSAPASQASGAAPASQASGAAPASQASGSAPALQVSSSVRRKRRESLISAQLLFDDLKLDEGGQARPQPGSLSLHKAMLERSYEQLVQRLQEADHALERLQAIKDARHFLDSEDEYLEKLDTSDPDQAAARDELLDLYFKLKHEIDAADPENATHNPVLEAVRPAEETAPAPAPAPRAPPRRQLSAFYKVLVLLGLVGLALAGWQGWEIYSGASEGRAQPYNQALWETRPRPEPTVPPKREGPSLQKVLLILLPEGLHAHAWGPPGAGKLSYTFTWIKEGEVLEREIVETERGKCTVVLANDTLKPGLTYQVQVTAADDKGAGAALTSKKVVIPLSPDQGPPKNP